jgi:hypothetical protein
MPIAAAAGGGAAAAAAMRVEAPHPGRGGRVGYPPCARDMAVANDNQGNAPLPGGPKDRTVQRYRNRITRKPLPTKPPSVITGVSLLLLVMYRRASPKCTADNVIQFLFQYTGVRYVAQLQTTLVLILQAPRAPCRSLHSRTHSDTSPSARSLSNRRRYQRYHITRAEVRVGFKRKVGSTLANQALLPFNVFRRQTFWHANYPVGVANVARARLCDSDEACVTVGMTNPKYGKAYTGFTVVRCLVLTLRESLRWCVCVCVCTCCDSNDGGAWVVGGGWWVVGGGWWWWCVMGDGWW